MIQMLLLLLMIVADICIRCLIWIAILFFVVVRILYNSLSQKIKKLNKLFKVYFFFLSFIVVGVGKKKSFHFLNLNIFGIKAGFNFFHSIWTVLVYLLTIWKLCNKVKLIHLKKRARIFFSIRIIIWWLLFFL